MVNRIIKWIVIVSAPVSAGVIAWAGFLYMTTGISDQKSAAKKMITKVFIGFAFILAAWLIVSTLLDAILADEFAKSVPVNFK
jgi:F0F1-type ATP synthase membrane subunit c/vacuolar-type H+-ATPase subunit K